MRFSPSRLCPISASVLAGLLLALAPVRAADDTMSLPTPAAKVHRLHYLPANLPDATRLLAPPPLPGSAEQTADLNEVRAVYQAATETDKTAASSEKSFSVFNFASVAGPFFVESNLPATAAFFKKVQSDAAAVTDAGKDFFRRPRPYTADPTLANGKLEKSYSYPSGHSTESMVLALVLADLIPGQRDAILAHARMMGWHRVQIARHYPTDIYAGRVLALAIVREFKQSEAFQRDFAVVKEELATARQK